MRLVAATRSPSVTVVSLMAPMCSTAVSGGSGTTVRDRCRHWPSATSRRL